MGPAQDMHSGARLTPELVLVVPPAGWHRCHGLTRSCTSCTETHVRVPLPAVISCLATQPRPRKATSGHAANAGAEDH